jgi:hypothetical protein
MIKMYCEACDDLVPFKIEPLIKSVNSDRMWGDILCKKNHIITTIEVNEGKTCEFVEVDAK